MIQNFLRDFSWVKEMRVKVILRVVVLYYFEVDEVSFRIVYEECKIKEV